MTITTCEKVGTFPGVPLAVGIGEGDGARGEPVVEGAAAGPPVHAHSATSSAAIAAERARWVTVAAS
jgi:hypothetical protein